MQEILQEEKVVKIDSFNGIDVYKIVMEKFKTCTINIFFHDNLSRKNVTLNAMIPAVLRRGSVKHPSIKDIAQYQEELYGSVFDCGVTKKGEMQIMQFYIDFISDKYTSEQDNLFVKCFDLLEEIITNPALENGIFKNEYVEQEKENLKNLIEGRVNDKMQYAVERCFEEMCKEEPFGIHEYGFVEDLKGINGQNLWQQYRYMLETLPVSVFVTGNFEDSKLDYVLERLKNFKRTEIKKIDSNMVNKEAGEVKNITERLSVSQGKLSLGFRTQVAPDSEDYYSLLVYNGILGGGVHSKLFQNVREKASLAYYAFSRLEKFKSVMVISSGIEIENKDKALKIMMEQLEEIKSGNISDYEFESTLKSLETGLNSLKDSQINMVDFYLSQYILGTNESLDSILEKAKKVTRQDVIDIAGKIKLDTVYFLTAQE